MDRIDERTLLRKAAEIVADEGWCIGSMAKDASGETVPADDPTAVAWCAGGALEVAAARFHQNGKFVSLETEYRAFGALRDEVIELCDGKLARYYRAVSNWNDSATDATEVSALMRRAAAR